MLMNKKGRVSFVKEIIYIAFLIFSLMATSILYAQAKNPTFAKAGLMEKCEGVMLESKEISKIGKNTNPPKSPQAYAIKASKILTITEGIIQDGVVLIKGGKIERVETNIPVPPGYSLIDASHYWLLPGFVDIHSHTGGDGFTDINDMVFQLNPELSILDAISVNTPELKRAIAGGVTTINYVPGSGSNSGGLGIIMKTAGEDLDEVVLSFPSVLKLSQAGNPERPETGEIGAGRMGMNWHLRELMKGIKSYNDEWKSYESGLSKRKPERDLRLHYLKDIFDNKFPVFVHTCWFQPVQSVYRMYHDEFGMEGAIITHGEAGAYQNAPAMAKRKVHLDCGPRLYDFKDGSFRGIVNEYIKGGVDNISINTDAVVGGQEKLFLQAAMAVRLGLNENLAIEGITINGARALGFGHRIGSIERGKDADLVIWTGNPLDVRNHVVIVLVNGKIVYNSSTDGQRY